MCLCQTPGKRPPIITGRFVKTVTSGWDGAPNERGHFKFHGTFIRRFCGSMSAVDWESRRFKIIFGCVFLRTIFAQDLPWRYFVLGFLKSLKLFFRVCVLIASGREILAGIFVIRSFILATSRFRRNRPNGNSMLPKKSNFKIPAIRFLYLSISAQIHF